MSALITKITTVFCDLNELTQTPNPDINSQTVMYTPLIHNPKDDSTVFSYKPSKVFLSADFTINVNRDFEDENIEASLHLIKFTKGTSEKSSSETIETNEGTEVDFTNQKKHILVLNRKPTKYNTDKGVQIEFSGVILATANPDNPEDMKAAKCEFIKLLEKGDQLENSEFILVANISIKEKASESQQILKSKTVSFEFTKTQVGEDVDLILKEK
ncbi:hypothetical protein CDIK_4012 [Cucumispora dikerogammari]|nr:hypothetical protein CDIK_4012 [Cucumispora dikerogammari]